jgi:hypothetical protein
MLEPGLEIAEAKKNGYRAEITWHICLEKPMWPLYLLEGLPICVPMVWAACQVTLLGTHPCVQ